MEVALRRTVQQFLVGHARPEEVTKPARQRHIGKRLCLPWWTFAGRNRKIDAKTKVRRHQNADERVAHRLFMPQRLFLSQHAIELGNLVAFLRRQPLAIRTLGEVLQCLDMAGFRCLARRSTQRMLASLHSK